MKISLMTSVLVVALSVNAAYGSCLYPKGGVPVVPDPQTATERQMMEARLKVEQYVARAEGFATCARRSSDKRAERTLKKAARLAKKFNKAYYQYHTRLAANSKLPN